jgi:hypothetical protein
VKGGAVPRSAFAMKLSLMFDDLVGDRDLAADGIDGHQCSLELVGFGQVVEEFGNGSDFIGLRVLQRHKERRLQEQNTVS